MRAHVFVVCVCVCACVCVHTRFCACVCAHALMCVCVCSINVCTYLPQVSIVASVDRNTYRSTVFELSNGSSITGLGVQVAAVSL